MRMSKIAAVLIITVLVAACAGGGDGGGAQCSSSSDCAKGQTCVSGTCKSSSTGGKTGGSTSTTAGGAEIKVSAPESVFAEKGAESDFSMTITAGNKELRQPVLIISNFGPYLSSSKCEGTNTLNTIAPEDTKEVECDIKVAEAPSSDREQEIEYELDWTTDLELSLDGIEVMTPEKFDLDKPTQKDQTSDAKTGPVSFALTLEDVPAETGGRIPAKITIGTTSSSKSGVRCTEVSGACSHHIEELRIKIPSGFQVTGLSGYSQTRCGEGYACYSKTKVKLTDGKYEEEFSLTLQKFASSVNKQTFMFGAYLTGVRLYETSSFNLALEAPED